PPNDLSVQVPLIEKMLEALRVPVLGVPGFEADDVIATIATAGAARGLDVFICSSDKDCRQLISDRTRIYSLRKRREFGRQELLEEWGVTPEQVIDLQTMVGDSVDNVPGIPGIGEKTAAKLLQEFGTLENVLANVEKVSGAKRKENLKAAVAPIPLSRQLVRLETNVPVPLDWEGWRLREPDAPRLLALFQEWGFRELARQVRSEFGGNGAEAPAAAAPAPTPAAEVKQKELF